METKWKENSNIPIITYKKHLFIITPPKYNIENRKQFSLIIIHLNKKEKK